MASNNDTNYPPNSTDNTSRNRRSSVTSAALSSIFRSNSTSSANNGTPAFPGPVASAALDQTRRRRLSVSTTAALGLSGATAGSGSVSAGPNGGIGASSFAARRASMSTNSSTSDTAFDENAIEDDDAPPGSGSRNSPNSPFARRMSFGAQAMRNLRGPGGTSPGGASSNGRLRSNFSSTATTAASGGGRQSQQQQQQQQSSASGSLSPGSSSPRSPSLSSSYVSPRPPITIPTQRNASRGASFSYTAASQASSHAPVLSPRTASDKMFFPAARADQGYNWPEQLRSRAESSVASGARPSFSFASGMGNSPPRGSGFGSMSSYGPGGSSGLPGGISGGVGSGGGVGLRHDRAKSVSDIPTPAPAQRPAPQQPRQARPKPDHFQERILKGDFYMD
ncbi:uncharacterized protein SPSK_05362 [Sporothrix schenckii 1099-18]|uniref:Uncharacterized protein n=1 Tax=Sporothrix schenckii 1099-18 TaxID=1397361 RepID=A0A0F2LXK8_SPOSC|nr:uncharacterized protein SPSK_05362 [Sporothrix schenckii 1099-18]KJR80631.1 hypothetical protein SPSK_05362 [Sporothrix schenckii 1099-18]